jgi:hypothetical protein
MPAPDQQPPPDRPDASPGRAKYPAHDDRPDRARTEEHVDDTVEDSFPASDPPAWTSDTGSGAPKRKPD